MTQATSQRKITYIKAINEALSLEMERDPNIIVMGEDIAGGGDRPDKQDAWGGPMRLTKGLICLLYTSPSPRDATLSRMPSSA